MSDEWDFYFAKVNDALASLFVDLGIRALAPDSERPWLLWIWVDMRQPRDDGLSSSDEAPVLFKIEDRLTIAIKNAMSADLVGRITTAGRREFYFYGCRGDGLQEAIAGALIHFPAYTLTSGAVKDSDWSQYLDLLYPSAEDQVRIKNRHVIESLQKQGDSLKTPRAVSHWIYFNARENLAKFVAETEKRGFRTIQATETDAADAERCCCAIVERVDRVDWDSVNEVTLSMYRLAHQLGGDYDGWETSVETSDGQ